ncbi:FAD-dependent oxidoreductase [Oscillospiraceae bacterium 38-13]
MKKLFEPGTIGGLVLKNRTVMAPMQVLCGELSGAPGERIIRYYAERARGGVGLIIVEATAVDDVHNTPWDHQLSLAADRFRAGFQRLTEAVHQYECPVFVQLHHYGAKSAPTAAGVPWACSEIPALPGGKSGHAMTADEIRETVDRFAQAARRAKEAGFDGVELAGAHGYLLSQFLSPYYNNRTDAYGGSTENRCRIFAEIIRAVKDLCGKNFPVGVRCAGDECTPQTAGTFGLEEGVAVARELEKAGADYLSVSNGNNFNANANCEPYSFAPGWKKHISKAVHDAVSIPVLATNTIKSPEYAESLLEEGVSDFVCLGRALIADPEWVNKARAGDSLDIRKCIGCMFCREQLYAQLPVQCALNPRVCREYLYPQTPPRDGEGRSAVVLGGGPAGMEAAEVLALRGFDVTLFEKEAALGGTMNLADKSACKEGITDAVRTMEEELRRLGVRVVLGKAPSMEEVRALNPEGVVLACGAEPIVPPVLGIELSKVATFEEMLSGAKPVSGRVAVIGAGITGLECAEVLGKAGCAVALVDRLRQPGGDMFPIILKEVRRMAEAYHPEWYLGQALAAVTETGVVLRDEDSGEEREIPADYVTLALDVRPRSALVREFQEAFPRTICVGNAHKEGRIPHAVQEAYGKALAFLS